MKKLIEKLTFFFARIKSGDACSFCPTCSYYDVCKDDFAESMEENI